MRQVHWPGRCIDREREMGKLQGVHFKDTVGYISIEQCSVVWCLTNYIQSSRTYGALYTLFNMIAAQCTAVVHCHGNLLNTLEASMMGGIFHQRMGRGECIDWFHQSQVVDSIYKRFIFERDILQQ